MSDFQWQAHAIMFGIFGYSGNSFLAFPVCNFRDFKFGEVRG